MDADFRALISVFLSESEGNLDTLEEALLRLETSPDDGELLGAAFRCVHTLKGNAESFGFDAMASCVHAVEGVLDAIRKGSTALTSASLA
jgi:two-component system, chemotaxis family, sensor kinase CheA